jgi:phosphoserine phosphatase
VFAVQLVCLDLEGVLVPEIWIEFAERTGIPELRRTTRDEPDYDKLMKYRLDLLKRQAELAERLDEAELRWLELHEALEAIPAD